MVYYPIDELYKIYENNNEYFETFEDFMSYVNKVTQWAVKSHFNVYNEEEIK